MSDSPDNESKETGSTGQSIDWEEGGVQKIPEKGLDCGKQTSASDTFPSGFFIGPDRR